LPALALNLGVVGYHYLGELKWLDALLKRNIVLSREMSPE
jgi:hypothetical protein